MPPSSIASLSESADVRQAVRLAAEAIERDADAIAVQLVDAVYQAVPGFERTDVAQAQMCEAMADTVRVVIHVITTGEPPEAQEPPSGSAVIARTLARTGQDMHTLIRCINISHGAFLQAWNAAFTTQQLGAETLLAATRVTQQLTFAISDHFGKELATVYQAEYDRLIRAGEARRVRGIRALLAGEPHDAPALGRLLRYDLTRTHTALVIWTEDESADETPRLEAAADTAAQRFGASRALTLPAGISTLWAWIGTDGPKPLPDLNDIAHAGAVSIAVGEPASGASGFRTTHRDAQDAWRVARIGRRRRRPSVTTYRQVQLAAMLCEDVGRARRFVQSQLQDMAVDDDEQARLRATLQVYLEENGSRTATAERLGIHPNTVSNRIRTCEQLLDDDMSSNRVELEVALKLAQQLGATVLT